MIRYFEQRGHAVDGLIIKIIPFAAAAKALPYWVEHRDQIVNILIERWVCVNDPSPPSPAHLNGCLRPSPRIQNWWRKLSARVHGLEDRPFERVYGQRLGCGDLALG